MLAGLEHDEVHVWCRSTAASHFDGHLTILSREERTRCDRFHFQRDRGDYANAHDLLRRSLSRYHPTAPQHWEFDAAPDGKPFLRPAGDSPAPLTFNLSHTRDVVACVLARGIDVGVDVERIDTVRDAMPVAARFFSPAEVAGLQVSATDALLAQRFIDLWTLKESFIKAIGRGLSQPLNSMTFDLSHEGIVAFDPPDGFSAAEWHFALFALTPHTRLAVAACHPGGVRFIARSLDDDPPAVLVPIRATEHRTTSPD